ncbi:MAG: DUF2314 domain-containing protein [Rhodobacteraceae bacterium]|nr:DUF2314 domain-containing protein [Paracoccaceae bacterium]
MIRATLAALCLLLSAPAWGQDPTVDVATDDPAMVRAYDGAAATLPAFLDRSGALTGTAGPLFSVKIAVPVDDTGMDDEVIWVSNVRIRRNGKAEGTLDNEPVAMPGKHAGDRIKFHLDDIRDWSLIGADQKLYGHYTTRVLLDHMDGAQADALRRILSENPVPADWQ